MAASVLVRLADDHHLLPLVHATLREWVECDSARQQWTAALVYSSPFGRRDLDESLAQLARIGSSRHPSPKNVVVFGVLAMLEEPADQEKVINTVVEWSESAHRRRGTLREVSLSLGLWLAGVYQGAGVDPVDFAERWTSQMQTLMCRVLADREFGVVALHHLSDLATRSRWDPGSGSELLRLAEIIAPDLRWWSRRRRIAELVDAHPTMGADIRRTFRIARRFQRRRDRAASGRGMGADLVADLNLSSRRRPRRFLPGGRRWRRRR